MADASVLKTEGYHPCGFESRPPYLKTKLDFFAVCITDGEDYRISLIAELATTSLSPPCNPVIRVNP